MNNIMGKGIYIHIPFCVQKCIYCDFLSAPAGDDIKEAYTEALIRQIRNTAGKDERRQDITSVFFGGGTPSVMPYGCIASIMGAVRAYFNILPDAEITIECNPKTVDEQKLMEYRECGINRISFGLQSADNNELKMLGRIHTYEDFVESYIMARRAGFDNINVDIMSAIPGQNEESLKNTFEKVTALTPEHISVYSLILEEGTYLADNIEKYPAVPDEDEDRKMYHMTKDFLAKCGYGRYEISNYSRKGCECRHNLLYWNRGEYFGFGCSAASLVGNKRYSVIRSLKDYIASDTDVSKLYENVEELSIKDEIEEFMFLGFRKMEGIDVNEFRKRFGMDIESVYENEIRQNIEKGLLVRRGSNLLLTELGLDVCNTVMSDFILTV